MARRAKKAPELNAAEEAAGQGFSGVSEIKEVGLEFQGELFKSELTKRIGEGAMAVWFGEGIEFIEEAEQSVLRVIVPTRFFRDRITSRFSGELADSILGTTRSREWKVEVLTAEEYATKRQQSRPRAVEVGEAEPFALAGGQDLTDSDGAKSNKFTLSSSRMRSGAKPAVQPGRSEKGASGSRTWPVEKKVVESSNVPGLFGQGQVKAARRLDNFVVGPCNRMAHTAAMEIIHSRGAAFNPLVLHGGVGLGKTHLLDGVAHAMRSIPNGGRLIHITAENFTNAFLESIRTGQLASFRNRFRHAGALVVDDVHFIAAKRATQNEFLHTFNALIAEDVPIILSCDQHPKRVNRLMEELSTRFMAGMVVRLETPDPEVRRLILRTKAAARGIELPDNVVDLIGEQLRVSVRELEGALNSLIAHSVLTGRRIDMELARTVLRDSIRHSVQSISLNEIESAICQIFALSREELHSKKMTLSISLPRTLAMYLSRRHTSASYTEIARHYGLKNHSSVIAAEKRVKSWVEEPSKSRAMGGFDSVPDMIAAIQNSLGV